MKDMLLTEFQYIIDDMLIKNKSILDIIAKFQESNARISSDIFKAVTQCGCKQINTSLQSCDENSGPEVQKTDVESHHQCVLCENCRDNIEKDIGRNLFYLVSLCNSMDLNLYDILIKELERLKILGKYNLI